VKYLTSTVICILIIVAVFLGFVGLGFFKVAGSIDDCMTAEDERLSR